MQARRKRVNDLLREGCEKEQFMFIENKDIILHRHIRSDGVHLNKAGTFKLTKNFLAALNGERNVENSGARDNLNVALRGDDLKVRELNEIVYGEQYACVGNDFGSVNLSVRKKHDYGGN